MLIDGERDYFEARPAELRWEPYRGAASYRVRISAVDGAVLWQATVAAPPVRLPAALRQRLHPAVRYIWTVIALGPDGAILAAWEENGAISTRRLE